MIIIAFSSKSSKTFANVFCRKYKHVAPIVPHGNHLIMYQFVRPGYVTQIKLNAKDLNILKSHGWRFVYVDGVSLAWDFDAESTYTCVHLAKSAIHIKDMFVQTPLALYKKLKCII